MRLRPPCRRGGMMPPTPQRPQRIHKHHEPKQRPQEEPKRDRCLDRPAKRVAATPRRAPVGGQGDGPGEPEDHGDPLEGKRRQAVEDARVVEGRQADVGEHEERPDRVEEHEGHAAGGAPAVPGADDWGVLISPCSR